jgi:cholesterol oxidase
VGGLIQAAVDALKPPVVTHLVTDATPADQEPGEPDPADGYRNLLVTDGSAVPANIGVNPSLTITAMAEEAMTFVPAKDSDR